MLITGLLDPSFYSAYHNRFDIDILLLPNFFIIFILFCSFILQLSITLVWHICPFVKIYINGSFACSFRVRNNILYNILLTFNPVGVNFVLIFPGLTRRCHLNVCALSFPQNSWHCIYLRNNYHCPRNTHLIRHPYGK